MGKKHQEARKGVKSAMRQLGVKETELGELVKTTTKAEARRKLVQRRRLAHAMEDSLMKLMASRVSRDIDTEFVNEILGSAPSF